MIDRRPAVIVRCRTTADVAARSLRRATTACRSRSAAAGTTSPATPSPTARDGRPVADAATCGSTRSAPVAPRRGRRHVGRRRPGDAGVRTRDARRPDLGYRRRRADAERRHRLAAQPVRAGDRQPRGGRGRHRRRPRSCARATTENADLFWALRGGGGNFGVVTEFEFALHPVGPTVMFAAPIYPLDAGPAPIRAWRDFLADKHDDVGSLVEFSTIPDDPDYPEAAWGRRVYTIAALFAGDADEGERAPPAAARARRADRRLLRPDGLPRGPAAVRHRHPVRPAPLLLEEPLPRAASTDEAIDLIIAGNERPPSPNTLSSIWNFGGATARGRRRRDTAFGDRSMPWMVSIDSIWDDRRSGRRTNIAWTRAFWERLAAVLRSGPDLPQLRRRTARTTTS